MVVSDLAYVTQFIPTSQYVFTIRESGGNVKRNLTRGYVWTRPQTCAKRACIAETVTVMPEYNLGVGIPATCLILIRM